MWLVTSASGFNEHETMICKIVLVGLDWFYNIVLVKHVIGFWLNSMK